MSAQETFYEFIRTLNISADEHIKLLDLSSDWVRAERKRVRDLYSGILEQDIANVPAWNGANHLKSKAA